MLPIADKKRASSVKYTDDARFINIIAVTGKNKLIDYLPLSAGAGVASVAEGVAAAAAGNSILCTSGVS